MSVRTCTVSCEDSDGHQHSIEVTAETLYEAVANALAAFKSNEWVGQIGCLMVTGTVMLNLSRAMTLNVMA